MKKIALISLALISTNVFAEKATEARLDEVVVTAIHQFFDAQLSNNARHAVSGHSQHHQQ